MHASWSGARTDGQKCSTRSIIRSRLRCRLRHTWQVCSPGHTTRIRVVRPPSRLYSRTGTTPPLFQVQAHRAESLLYRPVPPRPAGIATIPRLDRRQVYLHLRHTNTLRYIRISGIIANLLHRYHWLNRLRTRYRSSRNRLSSSSRSHLPLVVPVHPGCRCTYTHRHQHHHLYRQSTVVLVHIRHQQLLERSA